ncbi:MAG: oxaloacetate decarboxylase [Alphaproteobacteria bacterium]|nr:oxaloacetate decarboxylase [Alphaproteobacteria bacterium]
MAESQNARLKRIFARRAATIVPGAFNALSAKMIADAGFDAVYVSGAGVTNAYLGVPDLALISLAELADNVMRMRNVMDLPIIVDADTGFGNAVNVTHTIRVLEQAGANGIQLEDQVFPKKCGHFAGKDVIDKDEAALKIKAAAEARRDKDFVIIARTDARTVLGLEAALDRAHAFIAAGADVTFVEAPESREEIEKIAKLPVPQLINLVFGGKTPIIEQAELARMGYGVVLYANAGLQAMMLALRKAFKNLKEKGSTTGWEKDLLPFAERQAVVDKARFDSLEKRYAVRK